MERIETAYRPQTVAPPDEQVAALAGRQCGVIARAQLLACGLSASGVKRRVRARRLFVVHPGVYAVGHTALSMRGHEWAAVLAGGPGAALSHRAAGGHLGIRSWNGRPEVTTRRAIRGVNTYATRTLHPDDVVFEEDGLPRTSWARTVVDLAELLPVGELVRVLERSEIQRHYDGFALAAAMTRANGRRGLPALVAALNRGEHLNPQATRSELEELFIAVARRQGLTFEMNRWMLIAGRYLCADVWLPLERVVIELDSRWHDTAGARARDAERDRILGENGITTTRLRKRDLQSGRIHFSASSSASKAPSSASPRRTARTSR